jgi:hypothetical protein
MVGAVSGHLASELASVSLRTCRNGFAVPAGSSLIAQPVAAFWRAR